MSASDAVTPPAGDRAGAGSRTSGGPRLDELVDAVVQLGLEGSVCLGDVVDVVGFAEQHRRPDPALVERLVAELVSRGLVEVGDVYSRGYFVPFDGDDESAVAWFAAVLGRRGSARDLAVWLANTERGSAYARSRPEARYLREGRVVDGPVTATGSWIQEQRERA